MRLQRFVISEPDHWIVDDILIGGRSRLVYGGRLAGRMFSNDAGVVELGAAGLIMEAIGVIGAGVDLSIDVSFADRNSAPRVFAAAVIGESADSFMGRHPQFFARLTPEGRSAAWLWAPETLDDCGADQLELPQDRSKEVL
jgi:hypothetical protein